MDELPGLDEVERRSGVPKRNETPTEYVRKVLERTDLDESTADAVVEAYQQGMFAEDPTFDETRRAALDRFASALGDGGAESGFHDTDAGTDSGDATDPESDASSGGSEDPTGDATPAVSSSSESPTANSPTTPDTDAEASTRSSRSGPGSATEERSLVPGGLGLTDRLRNTSRARLGNALIVASVLLFVSSMIFGAALTPSVGQAQGNVAGAGADDAPRNATLVGVQVGAKVVEYDSDGETVRETDKLPYGGSIFGVSRLDNGSVLASYARGGYDECGPYEAKCFRTGVRIIDFGNGSEEVEYQWNYPVRTAHSSEVHDAEFLPSGELLIAGMEYERVFTVDPSTGNVTWQWNASSFYDAPDDPTKHDWLHINDVDRVGDGRYMVSVRNENQILFVERGEGVVEVVNEDKDPDLFKEQHNPQYLGPDALVVADSENDRVIEIHRNGGEWEIVWELKSAGGVALDWPRDADRLPNGNTLVTDTHNNRVLEVDRSGEVVWSVETPQLPYEADRPPGEYPAGEPYHPEDGRQSIGSSSVNLPLFGYLLASLRHVAPIPYWVNDWHLVVLAVSLCGTLVGGVIRWRGE